MKILEVDSVITESNWDTDKCYLGLYFSVERRVFDCFSETLKDLSTPFCQGRPSIGYLDKAI